MKTLITAAMYGLVPVPPAQARHAFGDNDDQPPMNDDANAALLAWYRHLATNDEIMRIRHELCDLDANPREGDVVGATGSLVHLKNATPKPLVS
jgi:hypothetical protein